MTTNMNARTSRRHNESRSAHNDFVTVDFGVSSAWSDPMAAENQGNQ